MDGRQQRQRLPLQLGDGLVFQGTQTYHGVMPSNDPHTVRYMMGFQFYTG